MEVARTIWLRRVSANTRFLTPGTAGSARAAKARWQESGRGSPPRSAVGDAPMPISPGFGWYVFAGAGGRAVARDIFLDGNTCRDSRSVDREVLVGDLEVGGAVFWRNVRLSYTFVHRTEEFKTQAEPQQFGSVALTVAY